MNMKKTITTIWMAMISAMNALRPENLNLESASAAGNAGTSRARLGACSGRTRKAVEP
jgi:hypothetical protein